MSENPYTNYDPEGDSPQELLARLLTLQNQIRSTVTSVGEAQSSIEQNAEQILLRVEKNGVISAINQSPEEISIEASRITLRGAVTVLSDITGDLGTITAGNIYGGYISSATTIDIGSDLNIGVTSNGLGYFDDVYLNFGDYASITAHRVGGLPEIRFHSTRVDFTDTSVVDFTGASVTLPDYATKGWVESQGYSTGGNYVTNYLGTQSISLEILSDGTLYARVNGKTATFIADSWTG